MSGVSSTFPELFGQLTRALTTKAGDATATDAAQGHVASVVRAVGPTITRLKYALSTRYGETWGTRMPLPAVDEETRTVIDALI